MKRFWRFSNDFVSQQWSKLLICFVDIFHKRKKGFPCRSSGLISETAICTDLYRFFGNCYFYVFLRFAFISINCSHFWQFSNAFSIKKNYQLLTLFGSVPRMSDALLFVVKSQLTSLIMVVYMENLKIASERMKNIFR